MVGVEKYVTSFRNANNAVSREERKTGLQMRKFFELPVGRLLFMGGRYKPRRILVKDDNYQLRETPLGSFRLENPQTEDGLPPLRL